MGTPGEGRNGAARWLRMGKLEREGGVRADQSQHRLGDDFRSVAVHMGSAVALAADHRAGPGIAGVSRSWGARTGLRVLRPRACPLTLARPNDRSAADGHRGQVTISAVAWSARHRGNHRKEGAPPQAKIGGGNPIHDKPISWRVTVDTTGRADQRACRASGLVQPRIQGLFKQGSPIAR